MAARFGLAFSLALVLSAPALAQTVLVNDNFDGYADQAALEAVWVPIGGGTPPGSLGVIGGTLSTEQFLGVNAVKNVSPAAPAPPAEPTTSAYSQRNQMTFTESGNITTTLGIRFSFDFYDLAPTASPYRQFSNLQDSAAPTATNQLIGLGLNNNQLGGDSGGQFYMGRILGYAPSTATSGVDPDGGPDEKLNLAAGQFFKLNDFTAPHRTTGWHNLKVELTTDDGLSTDYAFYVDNILAERVSNVSTAANFRSYDVLRMGSGTSSLQDAFYDNFLVETFTVGTEPVEDADFDNDSDVDGADFLTWQRGFGMAPPTNPADNADGDADEDQDVDADDLGIWKGQFPPIPPISAVPEPASAALAALALLASLGVARRK